MKSEAKPRPPKVFVSYSHDSDKHVDGVLDLADRLRREGVDCTLDQYEKAPEEGWPRWMTRQIKDADFVLMVCTETHYRRVMGEERAGEGKGARWEGHLIDQALYDADTISDKFIPVLFRSGRPEHIPDPLRGFTYYRVDSDDGYKKLYRRLTDQPELPPRRRRTMSPRDKGPETAHSVPLAEGRFDPESPPAPIPAIRRRPPQVFVSYAHEASEHNEWVRSLVRNLRDPGGVDALFDDWRVSYGADFTVFMDSMRTCDRVLLICTPAYARKANEGTDGVGYERQIITAKLTKTTSTAMFVCVLRSGSIEEAIPTFLQTHRYIDFRDDAQYPQRIEELLRDLHGVPREPEPLVAPNPFAAEAMPALVAPPSPLTPSRIQTSLDLGSGVTMELVRILAGEFMMGSPETEEDHSETEDPRHRVEIGKPFYMGKHQVTQTQWRAVIGADPSHFKGDDRPVECVSWEQCQEFCRKLSEKTGREIRLPTEAEWEYACRANTTSKYHFGDDSANLGDYAWCDSNSGSTTHDVGGKLPNEWGLYDMHGNVWEWCTDVWHEDYSGAPSDGSAWITGGDQGLRVLRGGSWGYVPRYCRSAIRNWDMPVLHYDHFGFRVVSGTWRI